MWSALGKYRGVVISIALFIILDASVLSLNFYISFKIADDAVGVNLAGRQRMLSQRTVKTLYEIREARASQENYQKALQELQLTYNLFNTTLFAFDEGGSTTGANGEDVSLKQVNSPEGRAALEDAKSIWAPYSTLIQNVLTAPSQARDSHLQSAITYAAANNLTLLKLMNDLTVNLENVATAQAQTLRYIQTAGITLAIINFFIILFHFIGELRVNDKKLEAARKETTDILDTVNEGLFLLDKSMNLGSQHSAKLSEIFGGKEISNINFSDLIGDLVKPKDLETAQRFVGLLFRPDVKDSLIKDLNPLNEIEINFPDQSGGYTTRYLSFDFKRVHQQGSKESAVLVTVIDVTRSVLLTRQLAEAEEKSEQQMATLSSILHTDPRMLKRFIKDALDTFAKINEYLKDQSKSKDAISQKLKNIFIEIHNFKGDASAMELSNFADLANRFETDIQNMQANTNVGGNDFLKLTIHLENLIRYTESVQQIAEKLASFAIMKSKAEKKNANNVVTHDTARWHHLEKLAQNVAEREGKKVNLVLTGLNETIMDDVTATFVNDSCIQFIRNAIVHSIEDPAFRRGRGKPEAGRIDVRLVTLPTGELELAVHDDGAGINYEKIRKKTAENQNLDAASVEAMSNKQLLQKIFEPGFSTADKLSEDAGRGVGMDVIKDRIRNLNGRIKIASRSGLDCQFTVTLPPQKLLSQIA